MYLIIGLVLFIFILLLYYIVYSVKEVSFIRELKINKYIKSLLIILILCLLLIFYNLVNFIIILIHLGFFIAISYLVLLLLSKVTKKKINMNNYKVLLGFILTIVYLGIGTYLNYHVFETKYDIYTDKSLDLKILLISDSHIGTTFNGDGFYKEIEKLSKIDSDLVVIVGDYVDDDTKKTDMIKGTSSLSLLKPTYGVYFVFGNHDRGYSNYRDFNSNDLVNELIKNNVRVLVDEVVEFDNFYLIGREDRSKNRKNIDELVSNLDNKYKIVLNHQPNDYDNEKDKVDLVLSGHTHGGQLFPLGLVGMILGENDLDYGIKTIGNTNFIVTSGISDWSIQFKTGTKSEYVIINIKSK